MTTRDIQPAKIKGDVLHRGYDVGSDNLFLDEIVVPVNGWIIGVATRAGGDGAPVTASNVIYDDQPQPQPLARLPVETWPDGVAYRPQTLTVPLRVSKGQVLQAGYWRDPTQRTRHAVDPNPDEQEHRSATVSGITPPATVGAYTVLTGALHTRVTLVENLEPRIPRWDRTLSPVGSITDRDPIFVAHFRHREEDRPYDYTDLVQYRIKELRGRRKDRVIFSGEFEPTAEEQAAQRFYRRFGVNLPVDIEMDCSIRYRDSWGVWSPWTGPQPGGQNPDFTVTNGPAPPTISAPIVGAKLAARKPAEYRGSYSSPIGNAFSRVRVQIWNSIGTIKLYDSGNLLSTVNPVTSEWVIGSGWHPDLNYGYRYKLRAQVIDSGGLPSSWGYFQDFTINSAPRVPRGLVPSAGQTTDNSILSAVSSDPDGDPLTGGLLKLFDITNNVPVYVGPSWAARVPKNVNELVTPSTKNSYHYKALNAGRTGTTQPVWPTATGATVRDNVGMAAV
ncbi:MAG: hypothetical protein M3436_20800, partial [Pseudomonadota bacterium]|nr:hypothetical protein [Pseudomonadota bacterium]